MQLKVCIPNRHLLLLIPKQCLLYIQDIADQSFYKELDYDWCNLFSKNHIFY